MISADNFFPDVIDSQGRAAIDAAIRDYMSGSLASQRGSKDLIEASILDPSKRYAIHDDDLNIWKEAVAVAAAVYSFSTNPISLIGGLVVFIYRLRRKRVAISALQALVLRYLRSKGAEGAALREIEDNIELNPAYSEQIHVALCELAECISPDGKQTSFVREKDGRYWAIDV